ncbi:Carboxylesterase type B [Penicillium concentricum]|uniref:Carboxylic ester hydrolase n=1 Tax=Penicillium concentricum TaxID=293559 RepID=A0A9W9R930_9EURO|nr:Carboxylesterase type B [Penicillium concentricum]KAJ5355803.1 Carboxylesterase type B [Penicillium concentricum]
MAIFLYICSLISLASASTVVDLGYASYEGRTLSSGVTQWLGMRFAAPPVGELRFAAPQDPLSVKGIQQAIEHGSICIPTAGSEGRAVPEGTSEDCLFLDIYAPTTAEKSKKLPVYFFIQGGGFAGNANANYNGTGLINASGNNMVVVTFNYRVGPYGFLAGQEVEKGASLNNGLKDQRKALKWVQKHISKFGGDPKHVVIGGDSAGAASITLMLSAYGGRDDGLFVAAAAESQSFGHMLNISESQFAYDALATATACDSSQNTLACLRNLDVNALQQKNVNRPYPGAKGKPLFQYGPTIDEDLVADYTYRLFHEGKFIKVPVIFGDDTNEGTTFVPKSTASVDAADTFIRNQFPSIKQAHISRINSIYLTENQTETFPGTGSYWRPASTAYGEMRYICPGIDMSSVYAAAGVPSWNYHYAVQDPANESSGMGTYHTVEVNAIWGPTNTGNNQAPASYYTTNAEIVPMMQGYWTSFITSLDPNTKRLPSSPKWETWGQDGTGYRRIFIRTNKTKMETVSEGQRSRCKYLTSIGVDLKQ